MSKSTPSQIPYRTPPPHPNTKTLSKATPPLNNGSPSILSLSPTNSATSSEAAAFDTPVKKPLHLLNDPPAALRTPPQTPNTKRNVGKWKKGKLVGRGASGQVYVAHLVADTKQFVAVKQMQLGSHSNAEINAIQNEIDLLKNLNHPNVVKYLGTESTDLVLNIFLEFAPGGSLRQQLNTNWGKLSDKKAASCTYQILCGLQYLHLREVFHRDVKGANVLVSSSGRLQLTDFGASRRLGHDSVVSGLKGTPHWMAPEVIKGQQGDGGWAEADVWSVGCTVIEMLTAQMPWSDYPNPMAAMYHIENGEKPPLPDDVLSSISNDCKSFIYEFCCCPNAKDRKRVKILLEHPWLVESVETRTMEVAEGNEGGGEAMLPGPVSPLGGGGGSNNEVVLASEFDNKPADKGNERATSNEDEEKKKKKKKKTRRQLPKTPSGAGSGGDGGEPGSEENAASAAPPSLPKRPKAKKRQEQEQDKEEEEEQQEQQNNRNRPLPKPSAERPLNRGSKTERDPESLKSNSGEPSRQLSLEEQQEELRKMMEEQSQKIWKKQQEIDAQQDLVNAQRAQQQEESMRQHQQQPRNPQTTKDSPRKQRTKEHSLSMSSQNAQPSPRWTKVMSPRGQESNAPSSRNLQINTDLDNNSSRPSGASAGLFVNNSNNNNRSRSSSSLVRQQAMEELARSRYQKHSNRNAISAGVGNACVTPHDGLSRQLPPLLQLREHQIMDGRGGGTRMSVPMLPMRQIASAPTAVLQPVIDLLNAEKSSNRLIAPLGSSPQSIHDVEREDKKRRKERRREKQRAKEEAMRRSMELAEKGLL